MGIYPIHVSKNEEGEVSMLENNDNVITNNSNSKYRPKTGDYSVSGWRGSRDKKTDGRVWVNEVIRSTRSCYDTGISYVPGTYQSLLASIVENTKE